MWIEKRQLVLMVCLAVFVMNTKPLFAHEPSEPAPPSEEIGVEASGDFDDAHPIFWRISSGLMSVNNGVNAELELCGEGEVLFACFGAQGLGTNGVFDLTFQLGVGWGTDRFRVNLSPGVSLIPAALFAVDVIAILDGGPPPFDFYYPSTQAFLEFEGWWQAVGTSQYALWLGAGVSYHVSDFTAFRMPNGPSSNVKVGVVF